MFPATLFNETLSMMMGIALAPVDVATAATSKNSAPSLQRSRSYANSVLHNALAAGKTKPDEFPVLATRSVLLRATSSLTKISTACHDYCARLSQAFTAVRFMEAMSALTRPFFMPSASQALGMHPWLGASQTMFAPNPWWTAIFTSANSAALLSSAAPLLSLAPKREIEGGIAMSMAAFFVTFSPAGFYKVSF